jgi:squalene synthase HpnC
LVPDEWFRAMSDLRALPQSKTHRDENFPVASRLIASEYRAPILAYYRFARGADDIADSPALSPEEKLAGLDAFEATLLGRSDAMEAAKPLREMLAARKLPARHALDLLRAFRMDAVKTRYASWDELMDYCAFSAAPVGRFVLAVHGESEATWPASDALCSALQVINHLQDCRDDYRNRDRVYIPLDTLAAHGIGVESLDAAVACPALRETVKELAQQTSALIDIGLGLLPQIEDFRLRLEIAAIARLARRLDELLLTRDPLSQPVHLTKPSFLAWSFIGIIEGLVVSLRRSSRAAARPSSARR